MQGNTMRKSLPCSKGNVIGQKGKGDPGDAMRNIANIHYTAHCAHNRSGFPRTDGAPGKRRKIDTRKFLFFMLIQQRGQDSQRGHIRCIDSPIGSDLHQRCYNLKGLRRSYAVSNQADTAARAILWGKINLERMLHLLWRYACERTKRSGEFRYSVRAGLYWGIG